ncbi:aminotransferase class V-fold PLP-dependent enzyme [Kineosporia succinea]|uniref:Selenocysteine lyase/cysteine desulfurase n=1 Tax=Kineosporia succinea TaxID=84632 RepID=A0ABT9P908_9ACTN|nr:aminotransferase class V-fold PLP-dependent enzyme [Kineosporia succinea]MDP9828899.1 selenocysteine lyase/cysteine desulfurase [Kineosporia succinea]
MPGLDAYTTEFTEPAGYLNFAAYGPPSTAVVRSLTDAAQLAASGEPAANLHAADARALAAVSRLSGFARENCLLTTSTSAGLQQIAFGLPGARVLAGRDEFPSNLYPWWRAQEAGLLEVSLIAGGDHGVPRRMTPETIDAALTPATTAVAISAVDFRTGYRADLRGIRDVIGERLLIVDGIQGFGVLDADWPLADALVVGGQKWLRAGWGTAFVALSDRALERVRPTLGSWTGVERPTAYDGLEHPPAPGAQRLSITNVSPFTSAALGTALELLESAGVAAVAGRITASAGAVADRLDAAGIEVLSPRDEARRAGLVVARVADDRAAATRDLLADRGITVTAHDPGRIRISVHATTDPGDETFATLVDVLTQVRS